jgi:replicative DNA helicase
MRGTTPIEELEPHLIARSDTPIVYVDEGGSTVADIALAAQKVKMAHDNTLGLIVVDYLQLVGDRGDNEVYRVGAISHGLKRLAMKLKCPVIAMAQLNRNIEAERRKPRLSDLRDSGAIEQDADVVVIMNGVPWEPERKLHILKQRQGHTGEVNLLFDGDTQRWESERMAATSW